MSLHFATIAIMIYIIMAMIFYAIATLFITSANRNINTNLAVAIVNSLSALVPLIIVIPLIGKKLEGSPRFGISMAVAGGVFIALFGLSLAKALSVNKVAIVSPIVFGGAILLTTVASYFIFKEKVSLVQGIGLTLLLIGLGLVIYARATGK